jgi:hypothetical protein
MHLPYTDGWTARNCSGRHANISLHSCACLSQTEALLETVPADWQQCACLSKADALLETVPADRQTSLIHAHCTACHKERHSKKLFQQTGRHLSSLIRLPTADRYTARTVITDRRTSSFTHTPACLGTDALLVTALRKYDHIAKCIP